MKASRYLFVLIAAGVTAACGGDSGQPGVDAGSDAGPPQKPVDFSVPTEGGTAQVPSQGGSGAPTKFDFPPSSGGKMITLTPAAATDVGWPADQFSEVIRMEPDGSKFDEPIVVRPASGNVLVFDLPSSSSQSKPEQLPLNEAGDGVLLSHFSTLAVVPPDRSCGSVSGWKVADDAVSKEHCTDPAYPNYISFDCDEHEFCVVLESSCCAKPGATACHLGDQKLRVGATPAPYDPRYPYCGGEPTDAGAADSGKPSAADGGGSAGQAGSTTDSPKAGSGGQGGSSTKPPVCESGDTQDCSCGTSAGTRSCNSAGVYGECICRDPVTGGKGSSDPAQGGNGAAQGGSGTTQGGSGAPQAGSGAPQAGSGAPQAGSGATQGGSGAPQAGNGAAQGGTGAEAGSGASDHECDAPVQEECQCEPGVWGVRYCDEFHYTDCYCSDAGVGGTAGSGSPELPDAGGQDCDPPTQVCECDGGLPGRRFCKGAGNYGPCVCDDTGTAGSGAATDGGVGPAPDSGVGPAPDAGVDGKAGSDAAGSGAAGSGAAGSGAEPDAGVGPSHDGGVDGKAGSGATSGGAGSAGAGDGGTSPVTCNDIDDWENVGTVANVEYFTGAWGDPSSEDVWAVGKSTAEMKGIIAHWNGSSWSSEVVGSAGSVLNAITGTGTGTLVAVGSGGAIYKYSGTTWTSMYNPNVEDLYGVWATDDFGTIKVWIVGASGAAHYWDGFDWHYNSITDTASNNIGTLRGVWTASGNTVWVVNRTDTSSPSDYVVQRATYDADQSQWTWSAFSNNSYYDRAIWGSADDDIWAVGYGKGNAGHYDGNGWTMIPAPGSVLWSVWGRAGDHVWAVGDSGQIDYWNGVRWTACTALSSATLNAVTGTESSIWAFGAGGIALRNSGH